MRKNRVWLVALAATLGLAACGTEPAPTTLTTAPGTLPVETSSTTVPAGGLGDGETFAWVKGLTGDGLLVDPARMLTGEEARRAAVEAGVIEEGEDLPNDFFILDESDATSVVPIASAAEFALLLFEDGSPVETPVDYAEFVAVLDGSNPDVYGVVDGVIPATVTIEEGQVTGVVQTYLP